jgi:hypothetical protein
MLPEARAYFRDLRQRLRLAPGKVQEVLRELEAHLEDRTAEGMEKGLPREEAVRRALAAMGDARLVAQELYATHARVSWPTAALAAFPHGVAGLVFLVQGWRWPWLVGGLLALATLVSLLSWRRGQPLWVYPWVGYALALPVAAGLAGVAIVVGGMRDIVGGRVAPLGHPGLWAIAASLPGLAWGVATIVRRLLDRDWLHLTVALLPFPSLGIGWALFRGPDPPAWSGGLMALSFLGVAGLTLTFYRLGSRTLRVWVLALGLPLLTLYTAITYTGGLLSPTGVTALVVAIAVLLLPPWLDGWWGREKRHRAA